MNTRLRPTPNAEPHIGHAWVAWKNYEAARGTGGTFTVIFDDVVHRATTLDLRYPNIDEICDSWIDQITWLFGEPPDRVVRSSQFAEQHAEALRALDIRVPRHYKPTAFTGDPIHQAVIGTVIPNEYAVHPHLVVTRVVDDALLGIEGFVRGKDLIRECALYEYICRVLGYHSPRQSYIPTITRAKLPVGEKESSSDGAVTLAHLRCAGYQPQQIIDTLEECNRRSRLAGLEQNVIPVGVLEPLKVRALECRVRDDMYKLLRDDAKGKPWEDDVERAIAAREAEPKGWPM